MNSDQLLIGDVFRAGAVGVPSRVAVASGDRRFTFKALDEAGNRAARTLVKLGVGHRDRVVMWANTTIDACPLFVALAKLGAVFAPANALLGADEAVEMVGLARPSVLAVDDDHLEAGRSVAERVGVPLLRLADAAPPSESPADVACDELLETDTHVLFFTSGSTGRSKGVILSHRVNYLRSHPGSQIDPCTAYVSMYPLFHMGAWTIALQAWQKQVPLVIAGTDPVALVDAVAEWKASHFNAIPAVWRRVLDHLAALDPKEAEAKMASLIVADSGTSATPPDLLAAIKRAAPSAYVRVYYGSTEAGAVTFLRHEDVERKPGSCGTPHHSTEVAIADDTGEMLVRGRVLFDGYFDDPEATAAAFTADGYFRTGDVAAIDEEGFYSIVGRAKDVIRTGGETVAPTEVEEALSGHPSFGDLAVVGIPDPQWGEIVCLAGVLRDGAELPSVDEIGSYCEASLAKFKRPRRVEAVAEIPRTPATNQVKRRLLIEELMSR